MKQPSLTDRAHRACLEKKRANRKAGSADRALKTASALDSYGNATTVALEGAGPKCKM